VDAHPEWCNGAARWVLHNAHTLEAVAGAQLQVSKLGGPQLEPFQVIRPAATVAAASTAAAAAGVAATAINTKRQCYISNMVKLMLQVSKAAQRMLAAFEVRSCLSVHYVEVEALAARLL
jgi:hypothetical protein